MRKRDVCAEIVDDKCLGLAGSRFKGWFLALIVHRVERLICVEQRPSAGALRLTAMGRLRNFAAEALASFHGPLRISEFNASRPYNEV